MTEFYTLKRIDNSRLVRPTAPHQWRDVLRAMALASVLAAGGLTYTWQHFQCIELRYEIEEMKASHSQARELNQQLKLETAALRSPGRIDAIARRQLGLTAPAPGQVAPALVPGDAMLAHVRAGQGTQPR